MMLALSPLRAAGAFLLSAVMFGTVHAQTYPGQLDVPYVPTPPEVVNKLHATVTAVLNTPEMKERLDKAGAELRPQSPAQFGTFIRSEKDRWAKVVKESGAKFD